MLFDVFRWISTVSYRSPAKDGFSCSQEVADAQATNSALRAQVQALELAKDEVAVKERQADLRRRAEVDRLESVASELRSEVQELAKRHGHAVAALEDDEVEFDLGYDVICHLKECVYGYYWIELSLKG